MNEKILDIPFENEFHFKLRDDEIILWENEVFSNFDFSHILRSKFSKALFILFFYSFIPVSAGIISLIRDGQFKLFALLTLGIFIILLLIRKKSHRRHILTNQRLIFHLRKSNQSYILDLPLTEIKTFDVAMKGFSNYKGDIRIEVKSLAVLENVIHFSDYDPKLENVLERLVIPSVNNTPKVLKLIRQARLKAKGI